MRKHKEGDCEERTAKAVDFRHDGKFIDRPPGRSAGGNGLHNNSL